MLSLEKETLNHSLEPGAHSSTGPDPGRPRSGHRAEATSSTNANATGAVFGPQLPADFVAVCVCEASTRINLRGTTPLALKRRLVRRGCGAALRHDAPCYKAVLSSRAASRKTTSQRYGLVNKALAYVSCAQHMDYLRSSSHRGCVGVRPPQAREDAQSQEPP